MLYIYIHTNLYIIIHTATHRNLAKTNVFVLGQRLWIIGHESHQFFAQRQHHSSKENLSNKNRGVWGGPFGSLAAGFIPFVLGPQFGLVNLFYSTQDVGNYTTWMSRTGS